MLTSLRQNRMASRCFGPGNAACIADCATAAVSACWSKRSSHHDGSSTRRNGASLRPACCRKQCNEYSALQLGLTSMLATSVVPRAASQPATGLLQTVQCLPSKASATPVPGDA